MKPTAAGVTTVVFLSPLPQSNCCYRHKHCRTHLFSRPGVPSRACLQQKRRVFGGSNHRKGQVQCLASAKQSFNSEETRWDVLGFGQAMVDFSAAVDDNFLVQLGIEKGARRIISVEERAQILELLSGNAYQVRAGGSLANTLANLGRLAQAESGFSKGSGQSLKVAAVNVAGSDVLGSFHQAELSKAGVFSMSTPLPDSCTGTVIVLTTPDANRTFLSYLGTSQELTVTPLTEAAVRQSRLVTIEGYIWEMPNARHSLRQVIDTAHRSGTMVAMTAGDAHVVRRHRTDFWAAINSGVDILFANRSEAQALLGRECSAEEAALGLGPSCSIAVVTDGANGSCISAMGHLQVVPPFWADSKPVDTCGAGDGYAAGLIYGCLSNLDPSSMGRWGARVASAVISKQGSALGPDEALGLIDSFSKLPSCKVDLMSTSLQCRC